MNYAIPKNEKLWLQWLDENNNVTHVITSDLLRDTYKLYRVKENKLIYTKHKADNPIDLEGFLE